MKINYRLIGGIAASLLGLYLAWYFADILVYVLLAGVLSFIGHPLVRLFDKIQFERFKMPHTLSTILTLLIMVIILVSLFMAFVPIINRQAQVITSIDFQYLGEQLEKPLYELEHKLVEWNVLEDHQTLESMIAVELESLVDMTSIKRVLGNVVGLAGSLFIGIFSVIFMAFFFLRDDRLFYSGIMLFVPRKFEDKGAVILSDTRRLLSRYFVGLSIELLTMMTLITVGLTMFDVESALLIGFIGGLMNVIPYLGPIIGASLGVLIGATSNLSSESYADILPISLVILGTFAVANLIDNMILQPLIYSTSVKAHPIEIFLIILMAGSLAGIPGMILAIPSYTVLRIVAKQFFNQSKLVQKITENI
ncbi:MAG TPA: AI-2E family transporter [Bacteroidales bacterium]|nr:AI-2E family transporter [Bacteroidales bacterium]HRX96828.1 AI-2E family transporter [Bacteroidales bacterium]